MKKIIALLLSVAMLLSMSIIASAAEDFTLRNGIKFGDTLEEILEKETTLIPEESTATSGHYETGNWFKGKIAGYINSRCKFEFNKEHTLKEMHYDFSNSCTSLDSTNDVYDKLYDNLVRQYGEPKGYKDGYTYLITGSAWQHAIYSSLLVGAYKYVGGTGKYDILDYAEWVIDADNYHVKIDLVSSYLIDREDNVRLYVDLSYKMFTDADYDKAVAAKQERQDSIDDDL